MTETSYVKLIERRKKQHKKIMRNPAAFKVCGVCSSISAEDVPYCPLCRSYRFHQDPLIVDVVVTFCVEHPLPFTSAVAPRVKPD